MSDLKSILVDDSVLKDIEIPFAGEVFKFKMRKLPWLKVTGILSKATSYSVKGVATVDMDVYYEEYLIAALAEAPWKPEETRFILRKMNQEFGDLLEAHVPKPGASEGEKISFFGQKSEESLVAESKT